MTSSKDNNNQSLDTMNTSELPDLSGLPDPAYKPVNSKPAKFGEWPISFDVAAYIRFIESFPKPSEPRITFTEDSEPFSL